MPKSASRKQPSYTPEARSQAQKPNPTWWVPVMVALFIIGVIWIVTTYLMQSAYPIPGLGPWNLAVGFGFIMAGFVMAMRWR